MNHFDRKHTPMKLIERIEAMLAAETPYYEHTQFEARYDAAMRQSQMTGCIFQIKVGAEEPYCWYGMDEKVSYWEVYRRTSDKALKGHDYLVGNATREFWAKAINPKVWFAPSEAEEESLKAMRGA